MLRCPAPVGYTDRSIWLYDSPYVAMFGRRTSSKCRVPAKGHSVPDPSAAPLMPALGHGGRSSESSGREHGLLDVGEPFLLAIFCSIVLLCSAVMIGVSEMEGGGKAGSEENWVREAPGGMFVAL